MNGKKGMLVLDRIPKLLFLQFPHQPSVLISGQQILTSPKECALFQEMTKKCPRVPFEKGGGEVKSYLDNAQKDGALLKRASPNLYNALLALE